MKKNIIRYLKHILFTLLILFLLGIIIVVSLNGNVHYADNPAKKNWIKEGPYLFFENDSMLSVNYITGNRKDGFSTNRQLQNINSKIEATSYFNLDSTSFSFDINPDIKIPEAIYKDGHKMLAISDIESGYKTFRDFLINNKVVNQNLEWTFGNGHLVLVGDFVDRGFSATQVLWFIYKLEQEAKNNGGKVHYILGNHEIKNLQGNYTKASIKYYYAAAILGKQQYELYNSQSILGKWLASKNTMELINGHLFVHGGIHPEIANYEIDIYQVNQIVRDNYRQAFYPKNQDTLEQLLISTTKGPSWYRGYFYDNLPDDEIEKGLIFFNAKAVIVGHTIQSKVKKMYDGKVFSIDVNHPKDYKKSWPLKQSEGLLIDANNYYRVLHNGTKKQL